MVVMPLRLLLVAVLVAVLAGACSGGAAGPALPSVAPADGVTVENGTDATVEIVYEHPNDDIDAVTQVEAGSTVVVGTMFEGRDALCVNGRLVAQGSDGAEIDELYLVCKGKTWSVTGS